MLARIVAVAGIVGVIIAGASFFFDWWGNEANLVLVTNETNGSEVDVLLRNTGDEVAIIHQARFVITQHRFTPSTARPLEPGPQYAVEFPIDPSASPMRGDPIGARVSQEVRAGEADRFTLVIGVPPPPPGEFGGIHFYKTRVSLLYNNSKELQVGEIDVQAFSYR
jgi:hypothetical protein